MGRPAFQGTLKNTPCHPEYCGLQSASHVCLALSTVLQTAFADRTGIVNIEKSTGVVLFGKQTVGMESQTCDCTAVCILLPQRNFDLSFHIIISIISPRCLAVGLGCISST
jgi:hypothetical protein